MWAHRGMMTSWGSSGDVAHGGSLGAFVGLMGLVVLVGLAWGLVELAWGLVELAWGLMEARGGHGALVGGSRGGIS